MPRTVSLFLLVVSIAPGLLTGCQSSALRARNLPPEFRAAASQKGKDLNLARLTGPGVSNSLLEPGDLLEVSVATGRENEKITPMSIRVANDGTASIPVIGPVPVSGMEAYDAGQSIATHAIERGIYLHPVVTVEIKDKAVNLITVLGAVEDPGVHEIPRGSCDVVAALAAAGGLTEEAGVELEIMRHGPSRTFMAVNERSDQRSDNVQLASYQSLSSQPNQGGAPVPQLTRINLADARIPGRVDSRLNDRDVIMVPQRKKEVFHVAGLVKKPGQFEMPTDQDVHLLDAIALAGGSSSPVADKVFVIRRLPGRPEPLVIQASIGVAKRQGAENIRLAAGDTITVERTPATVVIDTLGKLIRFSFGIAGNTRVF